MTFKEIALNMWPSWVSGVIMLYAAFKMGHKKEIRVEWPAIGEWIRFLLLITVYRYAVITLAQMLPGADEMVKNQMSAVTQIPIAGTLFVFWEDACHGLLLLLLKLHLQEKKWFKFLYYPVYAWLAITFAAGHLYQGIFAGLLMLAYIPVTTKLANKYGFGTVMIGHTLYDLSTILLLKAMTGSL